MSITASEEEIRKALPLLDLKWEVQNDKQDVVSGFIYYCQRLDQVISLANSNGADVGYAIHRWYNWQCSKTVEQLFQKYGATPRKNERDHNVDFTILGVPFDIKLSVISEKYTGNRDLTTRVNKDLYIDWLKGAASKEGRKHDANKLYVICDNRNDKCNFKEIEKKIMKFVGYLLDNLDYYKLVDKEICELIYVKNGDRDG